MQKIIILIISLFATASASAQYTTPTCTNGQVLQCNNYPTYQYDAAGNRTAKYNFCWCAAPPPSRLANHGVDSTQTSAQASAAKSISATGIEAAATDSATTVGIARIYPNPSNSTITVFFSGNISKGSLAISDGTGKQLEVLAVSSAAIKIDISAYPAGMYFLSLRTDTTTDTQRVIKVD